MVNPRIPPPPIFPDQNPDTGWRVTQDPDTGTRLYEYRGTQDQDWESDTEGILRNLNEYSGITPDKSSTGDSKTETQGGDGDSDGGDGGTDGGTSNGDTAEATTDYDTEPVPTVDDVDDPLGGTDATDVDWDGGEPDDTPESSGDDEEEDLPQSEGNFGALHSSGTILRDPSTGKLYERRDAELVPVTLNEYTAAEEHGNEFLPAAPSTEPPTDAGGPEKTDADNLLIPETPEMETPSQVATRRSVMGILAGSQVGSATGDYARMYMNPSRRPAIHAVT